jgi:hypothetical protein
LLLAIRLFNDKNAPGILTSNFGDQVAMLQLLWRGPLDRLRGSGARREKKNTQKETERHVQKIIIFAKKKFCALNI